MEITKEVLDKVLLTREGNPFMFDGGGGPITPRKAFEFALDLVVPGATKDSALETDELIDQIHCEVRNLDLTSEDVSLIKRNSALVFRPTLFRLLHDILEPPAAPEITDLDTE